MKSELLSEASPKGGWRTRLEGVGNTFVNVLLGHLLYKIVLLAVLAVAVAAPLCVTQVKDYEMVVLRKWGKRVEGEIQPGLKWYWPLINTVHRYDVRPRVIEITNRRNEDSLAGIGSETLEGLQIGVMTTIVYTLDRKAWEVIDDNFGSDDSDVSRKNIEDRVKSEVRNAIQSLVPQYNLSYLLSRREELRQNALVMLGLQIPEKPTIGAPPVIVPKSPVESLSRSGILVRRIDMQFDTPKKWDAEKLDQALIRLEIEIQEQKMVLAQKQQRVEEEQGKVLAIQARAKAEAETQILRIKQSLSPVLVLLEKWNGKLPEVFVGADANLQQIASDVLQSRLGGSQKEKSLSAREAPP